MLENITFDNNKIAFVSGAHYFNIKFSCSTKRNFPTKNIQVLL